MSEKLNLRTMGIDSRQRRMELRCSANNESVQYPNQEEAGFNLLFVLKSLVIRHCKKSANEVEYKGHNCVNIVFTSFADTLNIIFSEDKVCFLWKQIFLILEKRFVHYMRK